MLQSVSVLVCQPPACEVLSATANRRSMLDNTQFSIQVFSQIYLLNCPYQEAMLDWNELTYLAFRTWPRFVGPYSSAEDCHANLSLPPRRSKLVVEILPSASSLRRSCLSSCVSLLSCSDMPCAQLEASCKEASSILRDAAFRRFFSISTIFFYIPLLSLHLLGSAHSWSHLAAIHQLRRSLALLQ